MTIALVVIAVTVGLALVVAAGVALAIYVHTQRHRRRMSERLVDVIGTATAQRAVHNQTKTMPHPLTTPMKIMRYVAGSELQPGQLATLDGNYGFFVKPHVRDPIAEAAMAMRVDSVREYQKRDAQALKLALSSIYGKFGAPVAAMPPSASMGIVILGYPAPPPRLVASKNYGNVRAAPPHGMNCRCVAVPVTPTPVLLDPAKVQPNRRERRSTSSAVRVYTGSWEHSSGRWLFDYRYRDRPRQPKPLPWWRRMPAGARVSYAVARALADAGEIGIADPFVWGIDERASRCAAAERVRWRAKRSDRVPGPRAPELRTRRGRACSQAESYRLCP